LKAEEMLQSSPGLLNRQRIMNIMIDIQQRMEYQTFFECDNGPVTADAANETGPEGVVEYEDMT